MNHRFQVDASTMTFEKAGCERRSTSSKPQRKSKKNAGTQASDNVSYSCRLFHFMTKVAHSLQFNWITTNLFQLSYRVMSQIKSKLKVNIFWQLSSTHSCKEVQWCFTVLDLINLTLILLTWSWGWFFPYTIMIRQIHGGNDSSILKGI